MRRTLLSIFSCLLLAGAFAGVQFACATRVVPFDATSYEPTQFARQVYAIPETDFVTYDWALYEPEDFAAAGSSGGDLTPGELPELEADESSVAQVSQWYGTGFARFRTDYLELRLVSGEHYGIHVENATYAMRLWVDGTLLAENGTVADNANDFVPQTRSNTVFFTAGSDGTARIVLQRANFNHHFWNTAVIKLGAADLVQDMAMRQIVGVTITLATLLALALVNLTTGILSRERLSFMLLAAACLLIAVKGSLDDPKPLMLLVPDLSWYLSHRIEQCAFVLSGGALMLFWWRVLRPLVPRIAAVVSTVLTLACATLFGVLPSLVYTRHTRLIVTTATVWLLAFCVLVTWCVMRRRDQMDDFGWAIWAGMIAFVTCVLADALNYGSIESVSFADIGVVCVAFSHTVALSMDYRRAQEELDTARTREAELERMNESLAALGRMRTVYLQNLVHELKNPLAVIAGYSGLTRMQIERDVLSEDSIEHLRVTEREAARLGRMIERAGTVGLGETDGGLAMRDEEVAQLLRDAALFCEPVVQKRENRVLVRCEEGLSARCDRDLVLQVLYNLVINASRHCEGQAIELMARGSDEAVCITVADRGDGMTAEERAHAFERGWSGDGGSGYGLSICKDVADMHQGSIAVESRAGGGTTMTLTLPKREAGSGEETN